LGCLPKPLNLSDGQVAESGGTADFDARLDDARQRVAGEHLRCPDLAVASSRALTARMASAAAASHPFVANSPLEVQGDPPLAALGPCLLLRARDRSHGPCLPVLADQ